MASIQQVSLEDFDKNIFQPSDILIRIFDKKDSQIEPKKNYYPFESTYYFFFDCSEEKDTCFNEQQAKKIIKILDFAKENKYNITVQCELGIIKSCAIAEFAITEKGFNDGNLSNHYSDVFSRYPNQHILTLLKEKNNDQKN
jgi:predicted protein tyrosine phosphatase